MQSDFKVLCQPDWKCSGGPPETQSQDFRYVFVRRSHVITFQDGWKSCMLEARPAALPLTC